MRKAETDSLILFLFVVMFFSISLLIATLYTSVLDTNSCKEKCWKSALEVEAKSKGTFLDMILREDKLNCICYYADGVRTRKVR